MRFNKRFYSLEAIRKGLSAYAELCDGNITEEQGYLNVELVPKCIDDTDRLCGEFMNYCLGLMNKRD
ncbi:MAG: HxsD-like protein [Candidatus Woesearchaeota archaeon]